MPVDSQHSLQRVQINLGHKNKSTNTPSVGFIVGLAHNTFNKSINSMVRNIMWCMICTVRKFD
jgi:hypothetical protein